ncbi:pentapeptide MXKDX repeat protein [Rhodanobacter geophilus]|uniref:Pentapeptide MXKDX repeat protein n=1 Tax=Rhodanobacter geophilus TaxID=3162488 RepID=A0ABV3QM11_9GAMM
MAKEGAEALWLLPSLSSLKDPPMNARTLAALALSAAVGAFAFAPAFAQDAMPASAGTAMSHQAMSSKDAMKGSMHRDDMMKNDAMKPGAMKSRAMQHGDKMKKDGAMKMKQDAGGAMSSGG